MRIQKQDGIDPNLFQNCSFLLSSIAKNWRKKMDDDKKRKTKM